MRQLPNPLADFGPARMVRVQRELREALARVPPGELAAWGRRSSVLLGAAGVRRTRELWNFGGGVVRWSRGEIVQWRQRVRIGQGLMHLAERWRALRGGSGRAAIAARDWFKTTARQMRAQPRETAPKLAGAVLAHLAGRGGGRSQQAMTGVDVAANLTSPKGLAGDILVGAALEAGLETLVDLARLLSSRLPVDRDPLWDRLIAGQDWIDQVLNNEPPPPVPPAPPAPVAD